MPKEREERAPPPLTAQQRAVKEDWDNREFMQSVQLGVAQLATFLNDFGEAHAHGAPSRCPVAESIVPAPLAADATARSKFSTLNGKLAKLERRMMVVEATLHSVDQGS